MFEHYRTLLDLVGNQLDTPGRGGNVSIKHKGQMMVKSSGEDLKNLESDCCVINLETDELEYGGYWSNTTEKFIRTSVSRRPTMEYVLHKILPKTFVVHYHPVYLLHHLCSDSDDIPGSIVEYKKPGLPLAEAVAEHSKSSVISLRNHGVIIQSDSLHELYELHDSIKRKYFELNLEFYTPDDVVDTASIDLWMFRNIIENLARKNGLKLNALNLTEINELCSDKDEQYRKQKMTIGDRA